MQLVLSLLIVAAATTDGEPIPDRRQFLEIMEGLQAQIRDFELFCEGRVAFSTAEAKELSADHTFQSKYLYRSDGATYWEKLEKPDDPAEPPTHSRQAAMSGTMKSVFKRPDYRSIDRPRVRPGTAASLAYGGSPGRFVKHYVWSRIRDHGERYKVEPRRWEEVDGRRCLLVAVDHSPESPGFDGSHDLYWIDLDRGGNVLKHEHYSGKQLWLRVDRVALERFSIPGGEAIWFPVRAELDAFLGPGGPRRDPSSSRVGEPVCNETYQVVRDSLVFNQNPDDGRFDVERGAPAFGVDRAGTDERVAAGSKAAIPADRIGSKLDRAEEELEARLAEAERQGRLLEASTPSNRIWNGATIAQLSLGVFGLAAVLTAFALRRKS